MRARARVALSMLVAAVVAVAACKRASPGAADLASASAAAVAPAVAAPLSCRALEGCTAACATPACAEECVRRLDAAARAVYDALQACVVPACANGDAGDVPCRVPGSFACKMCVMAHCPRQASACLAH